MPAKVTIIALRLGQIEYIPDAHRHDFEWRESPQPPYNHYVCRRCDFHWLGEIEIPDCIEVE